MQAAHSKSKFNFLFFTAWLIMSLYLILRTYFVDITDDEEIKRVHIHYNILYQGSKVFNNLLDKYDNGGLSGLCNLGNTCYINSCIQILSHCYELHEVINIINNISVLNDNNLILQEWKSLKDLMWSKNCVISPNRFLNAIQHISTVKDRELFSGYAQNDLPEFLLFIIDTFHTGLRREVDMVIKGHVVNNTDKLAVSCFNMMKNMYAMMM